MIKYQWCINQSGWHILRKLRNWVLAASLLFGSASLAAQDGVSDSREYRIAFRIGRSAIEPGYGLNGSKLTELISFIHEAQADTLMEITSVKFCGEASPDGRSDVNRRLAGKRVDALEKYVRSRVQLPDNIVFKVNGFIPWEYLEELVAESDMPYKDGVIDIIRNVPEFTYGEKGNLTDSRKKHLMEHRWGRSYRYMMKSIFPEMRGASAVVVTFKRKPKPEPVIPESEPEPIVPVVEPEPEVVDTIPVIPVEKKPFYMDVRTNMLFDALAVPNVGVEFYLGKNWSIVGNWMYGWWDKDNKHRYWRIYGGDLAVRKWFGKAADAKPLTGHHIGVYGQIFTYDFEFSGKGYMGGEPGGTLWERMNYAAGIEYGYSLPIASRLNIDFTIGIGYWGGRYYEYIPLDGHYVWQATKNRHWFGPTRLEVSLVWLLGHGNRNEKKGGAK